MKLGKTERCRCKAVDLCLISAMLTVACVACFYLSTFRMPAYDELCYKFIFDETEFEDLSSIREVEDLSDVMESQVFHYLHVNGRMPVHVAVQTFLNVGSPVVFGILNALVYLCFIILTARFVRNGYRCNPVLWLGVVLAVQYMFPSSGETGSGPWYSVTFALNYLWPGALTMAVLTVHEYLNTHWRNEFRICLGCAILGLAAGWSNEAFAVPMAGGLFLYQAFVVRNMPRGAMAWLEGGFWLGSILLVFAPGTWSRVAGHSGAGVSNILLTLAECYMNVKFFWILILLMITMFFVRRKNMSGILRKNKLVWIVWTISVAFSVYAHTYPHSLSFVELLSMILIIRILLEAIRIPSLTRHEKRMRLCVAVGILAYAIHIVAVEKENLHQYAMYDQMKKSFLQSPDGVVGFDFIDKRGLVNSFVDNLDLRLQNGKGYSIPFSAWCGSKDKYITNIGKSDYESLMLHPGEFFSEPNRIEGSARMYGIDGGRYYYALVDSAFDLDKVKVEARFEGEGFMHSLPFARKLVYMAKGRKKAPKEMDAFVVPTKVGRLLVVSRMLSTPSSIELVESSGENSK